MKKLLAIAGVGMFLLVGVGSAQVVAPKERITQKDKIQAKTPAPGVQSRRVYADTFAITFVTINKGAKTVHHNHPDEQLMIITSGQVRMVVEGRSHDLGPGDVIVVPSWVEHQAEGLTEGATWTEVHGPGFHNNPNFAAELLTEFTKKR